MENTSKAPSGRIGSKALVHLEERFLHWQQKSLPSPPGHHCHSKYSAAIDTLRLNNLTELVSNWKEFTDLNFSSWASNVNNEIKSIVALKDNSSWTFWQKYHCFKIGSSIPRRTPADKLLVVRFKIPGRTSYNPEFQRGVEGGHYLRLSRITVELVNKHSVNKSKTTWFG